MSSLSFSFEEVHGSPSHNSFVPQESTAKDVAGCDPSMSFLPAHTYNRPPYITRTSTSPPSPVACAAILPLCPRSPLAAAVPSSPPLLLEVSVLATWAAAAPI